MSQVHKMDPFNHDVAKEETPMVNVQFNGEWIQVPKGTNVVEVANRKDDFLPHYCYHPKLSISGNCRMCLFEMGLPKMDAERKPVMGEDGKPLINWMPRPQIGCATNVMEGMGIRTHSPLAEECRKGVMEFLLINHPLDCPICDQAGECKLQEFSSEYGTGESRFVENKVKKPKNVDLGERIVLDDERCILCSRCVRFSKEVVQDDVLGFVNRGSHNTLTTHPGKRFDNNYSLNTVDICPVGALTSKDFRFKMRVWFLKDTKSICTGCARGCNIEVSSRQNDVYRVTPRENEEVNSLWMCDQGRFEYHYHFDPERILEPSVRAGSDQIPSGWEEAIRNTAKRLKDFKGEEIAIIASATMTNEELYLTKLLADELKVSVVDTVPRAWEGDDFLRVADKNPNSMGAELLGVSQKGLKLQAIKNGIRDGSIKAVFALHEDLAEIGFDDEDFKKLDLLVYQGIKENVTSKAADFVLAGCGFAEKKGTMLNVQGRLQRLNRAVMPKESSRDDWEILRDLRLEVTGGNGISVFEDLFKAMASATKEFEGLTFSKVGHQGVLIDTPLVPKPATSENTTEKAS